MSTARRIVIVGNCQARPLSEMLAHAAPGLDLAEPIIIHLAKAEDEPAHLAQLDEADAILTQLVADDYPAAHLRTGRLKASHGDRVTVWPNVFFRGQNPDLVYVTGARGRLLSPMGHYHSRAVYEAWRDGLPVSDLREEDYVSRSRDLDAFHDVVAQSFAELETRERETDVGIADEIRRRWQTEPLFHTFNHPRATLLAELARRIAARLELPLGDPAVLTAAPDRLATVQPPMERALGEALGLRFDLSTETLGVEITIEGDQVVTGPSVRHGFDDFARLSYACYDVQGGSSGPSGSSGSGGPGGRLDDVRFTPAH